jgi:hypothetical protein
MKRQRQDDAEQQGERQKRPKRLIQALRKSFDPLLHTTLQAWQEAAKQLGAHDDKADQERVMLVWTERMTQVQRSVAVSSVYEERDNSVSPSSSSFITGYYQQFFGELKKLGTGSFGSVFLCKYILHGVELGTCAVKKIVLSDDPVWQKRVFREVSLLERVHHPNIVAYRHSWLEYAKIADFGPISPCLFLLMEYANDGNLDDYIGLANQHPLNESDIWRIFVEVLQGLRYLHHAGVVHRDIKVRMNYHLFNLTHWFSLPIFFSHVRTIHCQVLITLEFSCQILDSAKACYGTKGFQDQVSQEQCCILPLNYSTKMVTLTTPVTFTLWVS